MAQNFWILAIVLSLMETRLDFFCSRTDGNGTSGTQGQPSISTPHVSFLKCSSHSSVKEPHSPSSTSALPCGLWLVLGWPSMWPLHLTAPHPSPVSGPYGQLPSCSIHCWFPVPSPMPGYSGCSVSGQSTK